MRRYIRDQWEAQHPSVVKKGDYVVATKYRDGDPGDQFCIGFHDYSYQNGSSTWHMVVDSFGNQFRHNGFRRVARIGSKRGAWVVRNLCRIEELQDRFSVWHWWRAPWRELDAVERTAA